MIQRRFTWPQQGCNTQIDQMVQFFYPPNNPSLLLIKKEQKTIPEEQFILDFVIKYDRQDSREMLVHNWT